MKKILISETERKAIISEREKAIVESFAKTFNAIKRLYENELNENEMWNKDASHRDTYDVGEYDPSMDDEMPDEDYFNNEGFPSKQGTYSIRHPLVAAIDIYLSEDAETPSLSKEGIQLSQLHNVYNYGGGVFEYQGNFKLEFLKEIGIDIPGLKKGDFVGIWIYPTEESWNEAEKAGEVEYIPYEPSKGEDFGFGR